MLKEMAMTIIATTISIILTFGSSSIIEKRQKEKNRRQTVMMVIHDIEENASIFREMLDDEKENIELAHYVINNIDNIDIIPWDTITKVYDYLLEGNGFRLDESKEKLVFIFIFERKYLRDEVSEVRNRLVAFGQCVITIKYIP